MTICYITSNKDEPILNNPKVVVSIYGNELEGSLNSEIVKKIQFDEINSDTLNVFKNPTYSDLSKNAILNSDGVVFADDKVDESLLKLVKDEEKPLLKCGFNENFKEEYLNFYSTKILN